MESLLKVMTLAQRLFRQRLLRIAETAGITEDMYVRYLSFQYHLTKGVQKHFLAAVGHPSMSTKRKLREFLFNFALEEEPHFKIAEGDLRYMGHSPLRCPLDVRLWWAYFDKVVAERPFVRLGATCVLENLGAGAGEVGRSLLRKATFLNEHNTRFLEIHFHEVLPHGDQIIAALNSVELSTDEIADLVEGAESGATLYLRFAEWAFGCDELHLAFPGA